MKYTNEVFQRLSRGQFVSSNSIDTDTRAIYNDIEENQSDYEKYFEQGNATRNSLTEFNSNNTDLLDVEEVKTRLLKLAYIQAELAAWRGAQG